MLFISQFHQIQRKRIPTTNWHQSQSKSHFINFNSLSHKELNQTWIVGDNKQLQVQIRVPVQKLQWMLEAYNRRDAEEFNGGLHY